MSAEGQEEREKSEQSIQKQIQDVCESLNEILSKEVQEERKKCEQSLQKQIQDLNQQISESQDKICKLSEELQEEQKKCEQSQASGQTLRNDNEVLRGKLKKGQDVINSFQQQIQDLNKQISESQDKTCKMSAELKEERKKCEQKHASEQTLQSDNEVLRRKLKEGQDEINNLREETACRRNLEINLGNVIQKLEADLRAENTRSRTVVEQLEATFSHIKDTMTKDLQKEKNFCCQLKEQNGSLQQSVKHLEEANKKKDAEIKKLIKENENKSFKKDAAEESKMFTKMSEEKRKQDLVVKELQSKNTEAVKNISQLSWRIKELDRNVQEKEKTVTQQKAEISQLQNKTHALQSKLDESLTKERNLEKEKGDLTLRFNTQVEETEKKEKEMKDSIEQERNESSICIRRLSKQIKELEDKVSILEEAKSKLERDAQENVLTMQKKEKMINQFRNKAEDLQTKLNAEQIKTTEMGAKFERLRQMPDSKVTEENADGAELGGENSPTRLAEEYSELFYNKWSDLSAFCERDGDQTKAQLVIHILKSAYQLCHDVSQRHLSSIQQSLSTISLIDTEGTETINCQATAEDAVPGRKQQGSTRRKDLFNVEHNFSEVEEDTVPGRRAQNTAGHKNTSKKVISTDFEHLDTLQKKTVFSLRAFFMQKLSANVTKIGTDWVVKVLTADQKKDEKVLQLISKCINLCWRMYQHEPPIYIDFMQVDEKTAFDRTVFKPHTMSGKYVKFLVWPAIYLHEGGPLLAKGVAEGL